MRELSGLHVGLAGGGTGGHVYPNLAVAAALRELGTRISYFVAPGSREDRLAHEWSLERIHLPRLGGMPRSPAALLWGLRCLWLAGQARNRLPDLIFSTGGYAAAPVLLAAAASGVPYLVHNLDSRMGLSNRTFARAARALSFGLPPQENYRISRGPVIVTGNPVRAEFCRGYTPAERRQIRERWGLSPDRRTLVVTGGSQGAQSVNKVLHEAVPRMIAQGWQVVHQMGETTVLPEAREGYHPAAYLEELWQLYAVADLAVARAGAMSIAELSAMRVPTIYVPLPWAAQDHQRHNVEPLVAAGAAKLLPQAELTCERLLSEMDLAASDKAAQMRTLIAEGLPDPCAATDKLVRLLGEVARDL